MTASAPKPPPGVWRPWRGGSASQLTTADDCPSKWWIGAVLGVREPETDAQRRGTETHAHLERWLLDGTPPPDTDTGAIARLTLHQLPAPPIPRALVERRYTDRETWAPIPFRGVVDLIHPTLTETPLGPALQITDHKTTSSARWIREGGALRTDWQARAYAWEAVRQTGWEGPVSVRLSYAVIKPPRPDVSEVLFTAQEVREGRDAIGARLRALADWAALRDLASVPYDRSLAACGKYRSKANPQGCPHRARCAAVGRPTTLGAEIRALTLDPEIFTVDPLASLLGASTPSPGPTPAAPAADPLADLLGGGTPAPAEPAPDPAAEVRAAILRLDPSAHLDGLDLDGLRAVLDRASAEADSLGQTIASLDPDTTIPATIAERRDLAAALHLRDPETLDKPALIREIVTLPGGLQSADCEAYGPEDLRRVLIALRAKRQTEGHAVNPPDPAPEAREPEPAKAETPKAKPAAGAWEDLITGSASIRGVTMPDDPDLYVSKVSKKDGRLQALITEAGYGDRIPKAIAEIRAFASHLIVGNIAPAGQAPPAAPAPEPAAQGVPVVYAAGLPQGAVEAWKAIASAVSVETWTPDTIPDADKAAEIGGRLSAALQARAPGVEAVIMGEPGRWQITIRPQRAQDAPQDAPAPAPKAEAPAASPEPVEAQDAPALPRPGFVLYVGCRPTRTHAEPLADLIHTSNATAARRLGVDHGLQADYRKAQRMGAAALAGAVSAGSVTLPAAVYLDPRTSSAPEYLESLAPLADDVIRGEV